MPYRGHGVGAAGLETQPIIADFATSCSATFCTLVPFASNDGFTFVAND